MCIQTFVSFFVLPPLHVLHGLVGYGITFTNSSVNFNISLVLAQNGTTFPNFPKKKPRFSSMSQKLKIVFDFSPINPQEKWTGGSFQWRCSNRLCTSLFNKLLSKWPIRQSLIGFMYWIQQPFLLTRCTGANHICCPVTGRLFNNSFFCLTNTEKHRGRFECPIWYVVTGCAKLSALAHET